MPAESGLRVVSLLPSATEIVCALGMRGSLVGVSHECDWPPDVVGLPVLTSARIDQRGDSAAIDRDVRRILRHALAVYEVDVDELARLRPDVIVTQDLCDVCAVSLADVQRAVQHLVDADVVIANTRPRRLADIWGDIRRVAAILGQDAAAAALLADLDRRIEGVRRRAAVAAGGTLPAVLAVEWLDPVMIAGMWSPELIELAGGRPVAAAAGEHARTLGADELRALDPPPDTVLVKPCGFDIERTLAETARLREVLSWLPGTAWKDGRVWVADGNAYFNRPGPRIVDSLELLAACRELVDLAARHRAFAVPFPAAATPS
jgi:iron complex transport system substrate-binding protein